MRALLYAAALALSASAAAHDVHVAIADISYNERTRSTEVVHTLVLHDLQQQLAKPGEAPPEFDTPAGERLLRAYVERRFALEERGGRALPLRWVGAALDAQSVTVYQERPGAKPNAQQVLRNALLTEAYPTQQNTVNLRLGGKVKSLLFTREIERQPLR